MQKQSLLLISRRDILAASQQEGGQRLVQTLANLTRQGYRLLATASLSNEWTKSLAVSRRSAPAPKGVRQIISEAGGTLDGVYYVPQSLLTQRTNRETALKDILERFGAHPAECYLFSSSRKFVVAARRLDIKAFDIDNKNPLDSLLTEHLKP